jgi:hypothetical protein
VSRGVREPSAFERPPDLWFDRGAPERQRILRKVLRELRAARARGDEWYVWVASGCPPLSQEAYERGRRVRRREGRKR